MLAVPVAFVAQLADLPASADAAGAPRQEPRQLEVDSILATFGLLFVVQGIMLVMFGGQYYSYSLPLDPGLDILGSTVPAQPAARAAVRRADRRSRSISALTRTRSGTAMRAVAVDPVAAGLVAIDVRAASAFAFALGGALVAAGGVLVSMFLTFNASMGVVFTMKALIVVIMGGVGNLLGALVAGLAARACRNRRGAAGRSRPDARGQLRAVPDRAACAADRAVREARRVEPAKAPWLVARPRDRRGGSPACRWSPAAIISRSASAC